MSAYLYILRCSDGSYYVGTRRGSLAERVALRCTTAGLCFETACYARLLSMRNDFDGILRFSSS